MKRVLNSALLFGALVFFGADVTAQITTTGGQTAQQLAEILAGPNITVTNAVLTGAGTASGSFAGTNSDVGFDSGVILSSGNINEAPGPNGAGNTGADLGTGSTAQMDGLAGVATQDAITLEFDFEVQSDVIQFNYVFASEEYPEYAPPNSSAYNDVFAFYISGLGITGEENIALVPNSTSPVAINNINPITNSQYYNDNTGGTDIEYDGYTTILEAKRSNLTPCEVYHLKLVICDAGDGIYSSAVFLQENSLIQGIVDVQTQTVNADDIALEGCIPASFTFSYDEVSNQDRVITFYVGGTAVNGVDYAWVDSSMTIVAGDTSATIYIDAFSDGITEGQESVWIIYQPAACAPLDTAFLFIDDAQPIDFTLDGFDLDCYDDNTGEIQVNATGGFPPYTYYVTDPNDIESQTQANPITGLAAGTYSVNVFDSYGCQADALVIGGVFDADTTFLPDVPGGTVTTYDAPLDIQGFNAGQTITDVSQIQQICLTLEHSYLGDLEIAVEAPSGEIIVLKQQNGGGSCDLGEPIATAPVDGAASSTLTDPGSGYEYCFNASPIYGTMVDESNNFTRNYTDAQGNNYTDTYLPAGSYTPFEDFTGLVGADMNGTWTVHVTDQFNLDNGYIFNWYISLIGDMPDTLVTLLEPDEIITTGFVTDATCGGSDGSINIDVQNGTAPLTYLWSSGQTTEDISGIPAGTYTVTVTDANGCQSIETFLVNNIGSLDITSTSTPTSCFGGADGTIDITATGGQTPYTFNWDSGQTTEDLTGIAAGDYTVTMTDQMGCVISEVVTVDDAVEIQITAAAVLNEECNTDNGSIDIEVTGGTGSYGYQWSSGQITQDLSNLTSGTYIVDVIDGNGCTAQDSYSIVNDVSNCSAFCFIELQGAVSDEICGSSNGSIDLTVLNAVAPISYSWSNGETTEDITGLATGSYTVVVTDANNCSEVATFDIVNDAGNLAIASGSVSEENCGGGNGSIDIDVTGGAMPYTFSWSNGGTTEDLSGLGAGTYDVTVTDGNGCQTSASYTVDNNPGSLAATATIVPELCTAGNGSINQTITGGNGVLTISWDSGQTTEDISSLSAGTYECTITDETGCYIINSYTVDQGTGDITLVGSNITNEMCGNGQGGVNITLTGQNQTYLWSNGATTEDITGVPAGNYYCVVSNAQGCELTTPVFSVVNSAGNLNVSTQLVTDEICGNANGSINLNISGGTAPYSFVWSNGSTDEDIIGLVAGTYSVTVTDANGCVENHAIAVGASSGTLAIQNAIITDEVCGDGAGAIDVITIGGAAPLTYLWSSGQTSEDLSGISAGSYTITITDANGCSVNETYTVNNQANALAFTEAITNEICTNGQGEITLTVTGGAVPYTYLWSNAGTTATINGLSSGTYSCTITDNAGCSIVTGNITVGNTPNGMSASTVVTDAVCGPNGSIDLTVAGGTAPFTYAWTPGGATEDLTNIGAGTYAYTVTDVNGCAVSGSDDVIETNGLITYTFTTTSETCGNGAGAIDLTPAGGVGPYTFVWSSGPTTEDLSGLSAGTFSCTITDNNGCSVTTSNIQVTDNPGNLSISNVVATDETCSNGFGSVDISITGGQAPITFVWSNGPTTEDISNLSSGTYDVVVTDNNGCQATTQAVINSSAGSLAITQPIVVDESCSSGDGSINISVTGAANPITYLWSNGATTEDVSSLSAGNYTVTVTDGNGCSTNGNYTVSNTGTSLAISNATVSDEYCGSGSGSITVTPTGGTAPYNYVWSNGGTTATIDNLSAGSYSVVVTDGSGCQVNGSYAVGNDAGNLVATGVVTDENCGDGLGGIDVTTVGGNMPLTFAWDSGDNTEDLSNISAGSYNLVVTDNFGCTANYNGTVTNITGGLTVSIASITDENCGLADGAVDATVTGTGIISTVWSSGQTTEDISGVAAGVYTLTVTNDVGCIATADATVANQTGTLAITFTNIGDENCNNGQGFIDIEVGGTGPYTYAWSDGQTTQDAIGLSAGNYSVTVTDGVGCDLTQQFTVINANTTNISITSVVTDATCTQSDGEIDITVNGGLAPYNYLWSTSDITEDIVGLAPGSYDITVTDAASCQTTETIVVGSQSSGLGFTNLDITDEFCGQGDGEIVFFTGGTADDYYLDGVNLGGWTADNLTAGTYTVSITDNLGCFADSVVTVGSDAFFDVTDVSVNEVCGQSDGSIDITVIGGPGGYDYLWATGETTEDLTGLAAGTYSVNVSTPAGPGGGCAVDYDVTIGNDVTFDITGIVSDDYCESGVGAIDQTIVTGTGLTYLWSTGATTEDVSGLAPGAYSCTVTDPAPGGCVITYDYVVNSTSNGMVAVETITNEDCTNGLGAIDLTMAGGSGTYTFAWDNAETTEDISGLSAATYTVIITDQGDGCTMTLAYDVIDVPTSMVTNTVITDEACGDGMGAIDLTVTGAAGPYTYAWDNAETTEDISNLTAGNYEVTITDQSTGCELIETYTITNQVTIFNGSGVVDDATCATCADGAIDVTLSGFSSYTYVWNTGALTQDLVFLNPGTYTLVATSDIGCDTTMVFTVLNTAALEEINALNISIALQPNPASSQFFVNYALANGQNGEIEITDALGKLIRVIDVEGQNEILVDASELASGTYFVTLRSRNISKVERLIITQD